MSASDKIRIDKTVKDGANMKNNYNAYKGRLLLLFLAIPLIVLLISISLGKSSTNAEGSQFVLDPLPTPQSENFTGTIANVSNATQLSDALRNQNITQIFLEQDIAVSGNAVTTISTTGINRNLMIDGQGHRLTVTSPNVSEGSFFHLRNTTATPPVRTFMLRNIITAGGRQSINTLFPLILVQSTGSTSRLTWDIILDNVSYTGDSTPFSNFIRSQVASGTSADRFRVFFRNQVTINNTQSERFRGTVSAILEPNSTVQISNNAVNATQFISFGSGSLFVGNNSNLIGGMFTGYRWIDVYPGAEMRGLVGSASGLFGFGNATVASIRVDTDAIFSFESQVNVILSDSGRPLSLLGNPGATISLIGTNANQAINLTNANSRIILDTPKFYNFQNRTASAAAFTINSATAPQLQLLNTGIAVWQRGTDQNGDPTAPSPFSGASLLTGNAGILSGSSAELDTMLGGWRTTNFSRFSVVFGANFDLNGGEEPAPPTQSLFPGGFISEPNPAPVRTGHRFNGWSTAADNSGSTWNFALDTMPSRDITLYAQWSANRYMLHFNLNGGSGANPESQSVVFDSLATPVTPPTRSGFTFEGWNTALDGSGQPWDFLSSRMPAQEVTLFAQWSRNSYPVTFQLNGGDGEAPTGQSILYQGLVEPVANPSRLGHVFVGWNTAVGGDGVTWDFASSTMPAAPLTLYAQWVLDTFNLHFHLNGGSGLPPASQEVLFGELASPVDDPVREGHDFMSWNTAQNGGGTTWDFGLNTVPAEDTTLFAQWQINSYSLSFDLQGGDGAAPDPQLVVFGSTATAVPDPVKEGHSFVGWNTASDGSGNSWNFATSTMPAAAVTLYAQWEVNRYNLTFHLNGGTGAPPESQSVPFSGLANPVPDPERIGFSFLGWNTASDGGGVLWNFTTNTMPSADVTLYAQWGIDRFTVTFDINQGDSVTPSPVSIDFDEVIPDPGDPTRLGHGFLGWNTASDGSGVMWDFSTMTMPANHFTLYAQWRIESFVVDFDLNGSDGLPPEEQVVEFNSPISLPEVPAWEGHTFLGWNTEAGGGGVMWDFSTMPMPAQHFTLYAQWEINTYVASFNVNGGDTPAPTPQEIVFGELLTDPGNPSRLGHSFLGWNTEQNGSGVYWNFALDPMPAQNFTLYAQWSLDSFMLHFHLNGGSGANPDSQEVFFGARATAVEEPVRSGFTFEGWNTASDGSGSYWNFDISTMPANSLTLYAIWTRNSYNLSFSLNGGTGAVPVTQSVLYQYLAEPVADPSYLGHVFIGWNTAQNGSGITWDFASSRMPAQPVTLYAQWDLDTFNLHFQLNGGSGLAPSSQEVPFGQLATPVSDPNRVGHSFLHWNTAQNGSGITWNFATTTKPAQDTTLYAQWQINSYPLTFELQGGQGVTPSPQDVIFDSLATAVADPIREGHSFSGWNTATDGSGITWDFATTTMPANPVTLYAQWEVNAYNLTFYLNGGQTTPPEKQQVFFDTLAQPVDNPGRLGYTFRGWNTELDGSGSMWNFALDRMPARDITLYAQWGVDSFTVDFSVNGGDSPAPIGQIIDFGQLIVQPPDPSRLGHSFIGWNRAADGSGHTWNFALDTMPAENFTLYAQWRVNSYMLHFHLNGGEGLNPASQPVVFGTTATAVTDPVRSGFTFNGWNTAPDGSGSTWNFASTTMPAQEVTLFAQWTRNNYPVTFDLNQGDGVPPQGQSISYQGLVTPVADPLRLGHVFVGWNTALDGSGITWDFASSRMPAAPVTLYAQWVLDTFNLHFNINGGLGLAPASQEVLFGDLASPVADPLRTGHSFRSWNTLQNGSGTVWDFDNTTKPAQDTTLFAQWDINSYTLSFDLQGGDSELPPTQDVVFESLAIPVADPTREGHSFTGWNTASDGSGTTWDFASTLMPDNAVTLYAQWEINSYNLHFHVNGGDSLAPDSQLIVFGDLASAVSEPSRTGFTFTGWNTEPNGQGLAWDFATTRMPAENLTLYAQWSINSYVVSFQGNGGSPVPDNQPVVFGQLVPKPPEPSREGHSFMGWSSNPAGTPKWNFFLDTMPANNLTLYAQWSPNLYVMSFNLNGGESVMPAIQAIVFNEKATAVPVPERSGFTFKEWNTELDGSGTKWDFASTLMPARNLTLYAQWTRNSYTVSFALNGGSGTAPVSQSVPYDGFLQAVGDPSRSGHVFVGWNTKADGSGTTWSFSSSRMPANPITLYAQWALDRFTLHFNLNGGGRSAPPSQEVYYGQLATPVEDPTRLGYTFIGWNTAVDGSGIMWDFATTRKPAENTILFAQWQVNRYILSFDLQGSEGDTPASQEIIFEGLATAVPDPTKTGYIFMGWNTASDGSGTTWDFSGSTMPAKDVTLYAQWQLADAFILSFDLNGAIGKAPDKQLLRQGDFATKPAAEPSRKGYRFMGWNTASDGSGQLWNFTTDKMPAKDVTLYAQWQRLPFTKTGEGDTFRSGTVTLALISGALFVVIASKRQKQPYQNK